MHPLCHALLFVAATLIHLVKDDFVAKIYTDPNGQTIPYRLMLPKDYDKTKSYPVIFWLHGSGDRGNDNITQLRTAVFLLDTPDFRNRFPCFIVAPQCPLKQGWADMNWLATSGKRTPEPSVPMQLALKCLDEVEASYNIDRSRVYITGLSMGGYGTWDCLTRYPNRFAAAVPVCGGGDESTVTPEVAKVPVWAFHSADDPTVPVVRSRNMIEALKKAGGHPHYTEFQGLGHASWNKAYSTPELFPWLFAQRLGQPERP
jgi:predicted peptidase